MRGSHLCVRACMCEGVVVGWGVGAGGRGGSKLCAGGVASDEVAIVRERVLLDVAADVHQQC